MVYREIKVKQVSELPALIQHLLANMVWPDICNKPEDNKWREYEREFLHEGLQEVLVFKMKYRLDKVYLQYKNLTIEHKPITIDIASSKYLTH